MAPPPDCEMLVASAEVEAVAPPLAAGRSFLADLDFQDLQRLRRVTRRAAGRLLSDAACDALIEDFAPRAVEKVIREAVDLKLVN